MTSLVPGDLVELVTAKGLSYVQVTHLHACYPETVRVLSSLHDARPADLVSLCAGSTLFTALVPLAAALRDGTLSGEKLGNLQIPVADRDFPHFRVAVRAASGNVLYWWLWDGDTLAVADIADDELAKLPVRKITTPGDFVDRCALQHGFGTARGGTP